MTVLSALQDLSRKKGLPVPTAIVGSTDATFVQLRGIAFEAVEYLQVMPWQQGESRVTVTSIDGTNQGTLESLFGGSLLTFQRGSLWDVSSNRPILGPVDADYWQVLSSQPAGGPEYVYRIYNDELHVWPAMTAGRTLSAIIQSQWVVVGSDTVRKAQITADSDSFIFPEAVFKKQVEWRWLKEKGEPWTATFEESKALTLTHLGMRGAGSRLQMDTTAATVSPGIYIPSGSWNL